MSIELVQVTFNCLVLKNSQKTTFTSSVIATVTDSLALSVTVRSLACNPLKSSDLF